MMPDSRISATAPFDNRRPGYRIDFRMVSGVLGGLLFFLGISMLIPFLVALLFREESWSAFLIPSLAAMLAGGALFWRFRPRHELRMREVFMIVTLSWLLGSLTGAIPWILSGSLAAWTDAIFETMSGLSTTGATILGGINRSGHINPAIEALDRSLLLWRSLTQWIGGMGMIVLSLALLPLLGVGGMQLFKAEYSGSTADKITPRIQETAFLLWSIYLGLTALLFLLLWGHPSMEWFDALNHSLTTLATGGFSTRSDSVAAFGSLYVELLILLFMILGGMNFVLHFRLMKGDFDSLRRNRELRFYLFLILLFSAGVTAGLWLPGDRSFGEALRHGSFQVVSVLTTSGFVSADYSLWSPFASFLLFLLFFTGGCAGSTSGGIKMIRILVILKNIKRELKQILHPQAILPIRLGTRIVEMPILRTILGFFVTYLLIFAIGSLLLTMMGYDLMTAMGASIACLGNVGPAWGEFGVTGTWASLPWIGKWVLLLMMMVGRLELFTVLILFTPFYWKN